MASLRNGGDRPTVRRGTSPAPSGTAQRVRPSSASSSRPSSKAHSPDKEHPAPGKHTPNYLKPTLSSKAPDAGTHPKAKTDTAAPAKKLARIRSMEKPTSLHPHPARTAPAAGIKSSAATVKPSTVGSSSSTRAAASSTRAATDKTRKPATKPSAPGATKARASAGLGAGKKKEPGASASGSPTAAAAHQHDATERGLENKDHDEPKTISIDPASPSAQEEHHGEVEHDTTEEGAEREHLEEEHCPPESEEPHDGVLEPEQETQRGSADSLHTEHEGTLKIEAKQSEDDSQATPDGHPDEDHSTSSPPAPAAETNKFLTRSRTVPARPKPSDAAKIPVDDELQRKLMSRKAWETGGGNDTTSQKNGGDDTSSPGIKRQDTLGKKESPAYNDVIEETASKLNEKRKNKVLALAGAFETVISLQEPKTPQSGQQSSATAPAGWSGAGEAQTPPAPVVAEVDNITADEHPQNTEAKEEVPTESEDVATNSSPDEGYAAAVTAKE